MGLNSEVECKSGWSNAIWLVTVECSKSCDTISFVQLNQCTRWFEASPSNVSLANWILMGKFSSWTFWMIIYLFCIWNDFWNFFGAYGLFRCSSAYSWILLYRVFPSGGTGGTTHELYVPPHNSCVPPIKSKNCSPPPIFVDQDKFFFRYFSIFAWQRLIWPA